MTIYFIIRGIPSAQDPQWGCFEFDQAKALAKLGHEVVCLSVDRRFRWYYRKFGITKQQKEGVTAYNSFLMPNTIVRKLFGEKILYKFRLWQLNKLFKRAIYEIGSPDILYSHYLFITQEAVALKKAYNIPLVAIEHWSELQKSTLSPRIQQYTKSYNNVDQLIAVCGSLQSAIKRHTNIDSKIIYNMVGGEFHYFPTPSSSIVRFITTGSLIYRKGFDLLAKAFTQLNMPKDKWKLKIIGEGEEHALLQKQIEEAGFKNNIQLVGSKNKDEIAKMLNESDIFVLPSRNENFSVAVLEALACGLPVVASICGGIRECIDDKNGLLFEVNDVDGLANCLNYMFHHYQEYDREAIAENCQARFSSEVIAKQLTGIFEDVVAKHPTKATN